MLPLYFLDQLGSANTTDRAGTVASQQTGGGAVRSADSVTSPAADDDVDVDNATAANNNDQADGQNGDGSAGTPADIIPDESADELLSESEDEASTSKSQFILTNFG